MSSIFLRSFLLRLGTRNIDWQSLGVRLVDAFTKPSINERLDTLEAKHAETHAAIPAAVEKFDKMVARNQEILNEIKAFHETRRERIDDLIATLERLEDNQDQLLEHIKKIDVDISRLDPAEL